MYLYYDYYVNFDWCRKVPYSRNQVHGVSRGAASGPCGSGLFFRTVPQGPTVRKNSPESQGPDAAPRGPRAALPRYLVRLRSPGAARATGVLTTCMHSQYPMISFHNPGIICTGIPYIPEFHIHVPSYCAYEELRAAGDSEIPGPYRHLKIRCAPATSHHANFAPYLHVSM